MGHQMDEIEREVAALGLNDDASPSELAARALARGPTQVNLAVNVSGTLPAPAGAAAVASGFSAIAGNFQRPAQALASELSGINDKLVGGLPAPAGAAVVASEYSAITENSQRQAQAFAAGLSGINDELVLAAAAESAAVASEFSAIVDDSQSPGQALASALSGISGKLPSSENLKDLQNQAANVLNGTGPSSNGMIALASDLSALDGQLDLSPSKALALAAGVQSSSTEVWSKAQAELSGDMSAGILQMGQDLASLAQQHKQMLAIPEIRTGIQKSVPRVGQTNNSDAEVNRDAMQKERLNPMATAMQWQPVAPTTDGDLPVRISSFHLKSHCGKKNVAKAAFWPVGKSLSPEKLADVLFTTWKLPRPNLVMNIEAGAAHPAKLSTRELRQLPQFRDWCHQAELQRRLHVARDIRKKGGPAILLDNDLRAALPSNVQPLAQSGAFNGMPPKQAFTGMLPTQAVNGMPPTPAETPALAADHPGVLDAFDDFEKEEHCQESIINECIFDKLVSIVAAIVDASSKTNNYIVIDRTSANGSSCTAELLLELALQLVESTPIILVIERRSRIKQFLSAEARAQLKMINQIEEASIQHGTDQVIKRVDCPALYLPTEFSTEDTFRGENYWDLMLPTKPDPSHVLATGKGTEVSYLAPDEDTKHVKMERAVMNEKRIWSYHYSQYMFSSGTHYIFLEDDDQVFAADSLGPVGAVFAHGGTAAYHRMRSWLQQGRPSVMLLNSGGVTQAFASLHNGIVRHDNLDIQRLIRLVEVTSSENWAVNFGLTECIMMAELKRRAPILMRKSMVSVDILKDSAEDVLQVVTGCFAYAQGQLPELGLRSAESHSILRAWRQHLILYQSAREQQTAADFQFCVQTSLLLITSIVAAYKSELALGTIASNRIKDEVLYIIVITLPIVTGLVATRMQKRRCLMKWAILHSSAMRIVVEIYKYRARVLEYDTESNASKSVKQDNGEEERVRVRPARRARVRFVKRVQEIFAEPLDGEMNDDALSISLKQEDSEHTRPINEEALKKHVQQNLLRLPANSDCWSILCMKVADCLCCCCHKRRKHPKDQHSRKKPPSILPVTASDVHHMGSAPPANTHNLDTKDIYNNVEEDDFQSIISAEAYMEHRMKPIMMLCGSNAPRVAWRLQMLEGFSLFVNAVTVGLAVPRDVEVSHWLTMCVSFKVLVMNIIDYSGFGMRLTAFNSGVKEMQNLLTWWESLSVIDRRTREAKTLAVVTVEQAMLKVALARTGELASVSNASAAMGRLGGDGEEDEASPSAEGGGKSKSE